MSIQYKVINRDNRKEYILNAEELSKFFKHQLITNYAVSRVPSNRETFFGNLAIACFSLAFIILTTKIIMEWI